MTTSRRRPRPKKPLWIIVLISLVCFSLIGVYIFPPDNYPACYLLSSKVCTPFLDWLPPSFVREYSDEELAANAVFHNLLMLPSVQASTPKIAFLFLTPGTLPFEKLWEKFFLVMGTFYFVGNDLFVLVLLMGLAVRGWRETRSQMNAIIITIS